MLRLAEEKIVAGHVAPSNGTVVYAMPFQKSNQHSHLELMP